MSIANDVLAITQGIARLCKEHTDPAGEKNTELSKIAGAIVYFIALFTENCDPNFRRIVLQLLKDADDKDI